VGGEPSLRPRAQRILEEELGREVELRWMEGTKPGEGQGRVKIQEDLAGVLRKGERVGYTNGSRMEGVAARASAEGGLFLGSYATVMDAEMIGVARAWEEGYETVAVDSQAAIRRCVNLIEGVQRGGSWIDERVIKAVGEAERRMIWVKGHSGCSGNEAADKRAKDKVREGIWNSDRSLATPAGIRQAYPLFSKEPHMKWDRDELRGLTYLHTDKGPQKAWLFKIGRASDPRCKCGEVQSAAHLIASGCVGNMKRNYHL